MAIIKARSPEQKALAINLDENIYGAFAEIGAGQEVARYFFQAGGAAGTMAKAMSAYDMEISDIIYGKEKSGRYVCQDRLLTMLDREYDLLVKRLKNIRPKGTKFFTFANTVAAKSFSGRGECHGWIGVKFQHEESSSSSEVILHIKMLDQENLQQQEAIGMIGVNLLHSCFYHYCDPNSFISSLMDGVSRRRIEIDMIRVKGKAFLGMDSRILSLELVKQNFCEAIMFDEKGLVTQISDSLYKKNIVVLRGSYRPPTFVNMDMLEAGHKQFEKSLSESERKDIVVLPEISMSKLIERGEVDNSDFLARIDLLTGLGHKVLISSSENIEDLSLFLSRSCRKKLAFVLGVYPFEQMMNPNNYKSSEGGILGSLGKFFGHSTQLYIYPAKDDKNPKTLKNLENAEIKKEVELLYLHLMAGGQISEIEEFNLSHSEIWSRTVLQMIQNKRPGWESMVPKKVVKLVKEKKLFGFS